MAGSAGSAGATELSAIVAEYDPSFTQEFLCLFGGGAGAGSFGPRHHGVRGWRVRGVPDLKALDKALLLVVQRHEALRTQLDHQARPPVCRIFQPSPAELLVVDICEPDPANRDQRAEQFLNDLEVAELSVQQLPHLRLVLGQLDAEDWVLAVMAHHAAIDGWSIEQLFRELSESYASYLVGGQPRLEDVLPYRRYAAWQRRQLTGAVIDEACDYWGRKLAGAAMRGLPNDRERDPVADRVSAAYRFVIDTDLSAAVHRYARATRTSALTVSLTVQNLLLSRRTGSTDVVLPAITNSSGHPDYESTVGPFFNFVPLRTELSGCVTFADLLAATRQTRLQAHTFEMPFAFVLREVPQLLAAFADPTHSVCAFQTFQFARTSSSIMGNLAVSAIRHRVLSQPVGSDVPDGTLWTMELDPSAGMYGSLRYNSKEFDESSMAELAAEYSELLRQLVSTPDAAIPLP
ncbi:MAG: condensation domain-containing protein [Jatrophihabitantaceae bacterium]